MILIAMNWNPPNVFKSVFNSVVKKNESSLKKERELIYYTEPLVNKIIKHHPSKGDRLAMFSSSSLLA